jgi:hypothetical protein
MNIAWESKRAIERRNRTQLQKFIDWLNEGWI